MMTLKHLTAALLLALPAATAATIVHTYTDRAVFAASVSRVTALPLAVPGAPPVFLPNYVSGGLTLTALDGQLAGDGIDLLSTELDGDTLVLDFAKPLYGVGLFGGVVDFDFAHIDGSLLVEAVGSGTATLLANGGAGFLGLRSDTAFSQLRMSVASFDGDASSVAFAAVQDHVDLAGGVPEPAAWALLIAGFVLVGSRQRARHDRSIAA